MDKRWIFSALAISLLVALLLIGPRIELTEAQGDPDPIPTIAITMSGIENGTTFKTSTITFRLTLQAPSWPNQNPPTNFNCVLTLDGGFVKRYYYPGSQSVILRNLAEGTHYIQIDSSAIYTLNQPIQANSSTGKIYFTINTTTSPMFLVTTVNGQNVAVSFLTSKPATWIGYSLDAGGNVTIIDAVDASRLSGLYNYTYHFSGLVEGQHTLTYYFQSTTGNIEKVDTISFTVGNSATPTPSPSKAASPSPSAEPSPNPQSAQPDEQSPAPTVDDYTGWIPYMIFLLALVAGFAFVVYVTKYGKRT